MLRNFRNGLNVIIASSLLLSGASILKPKAALAGGGFAQSCQNIRFNDPNDPNMIAQCRNRGGQLRLAAIDLNRYIVNNGGHLAWQTNGGFSGSCTIDRFVNNGVMSVHCKNRQGKNVNSRFDLNPRILNDDGFLKYGGE